MPTSFIPSTFLKRVKKIKNLKIMSFSALLKPLLGGNEAPVAEHEIHPVYITVELLKRLSR